MRRTQVYLTEAQYRKLDVMAKALGLTLAELIRQGVDLVLREKAGLGQDPVLDLVGQDPHFARAGFTRVPVDLEL